MAAELRAEVGAEVSLPRRGNHLWARRRYKASDGEEGRAWVSEMGLG